MSGRRGPSDATSDRDRLRSAFTRAASWFGTSPLYRGLCGTVVRDDELLDLVATRRPGQQPANLLFGAVHFLVLDEPDEPLAQWYPSIVGDRARLPTTAGPAFVAFCLRRRDELETLLRTRLVQTNVVDRAAALRYSMGRVARLVDGPVAFLEVGASAGVHLRFDR